MNDDRFASRRAPLRAVIAIVIVTNLAVTMVALWPAPDTGACDLAARVTASTDATAEMREFAQSRCDQEKGDRRRAFTRLGVVWLVYLTAASAGAAYRIRKQRTGASGRGS